MNDILEELKKGRFSERDEISDLQVYKMCDIPYSIPIYSSPEFRKYIASAIEAYVTNKNLYDILSCKNVEDYSDDKWINQDLMINYQISQSVDTISCMIADYYKSINNTQKELSIGERLYFASLIRLRDSFKSAIILCDRSLFIEMMPVLRFIFEQLCCCCYVIDEDDINKLKSNKSYRDVKYLKEKIAIKYGKYYSFLSNEAHMSPDNIGKYIETCTDGKIYFNGRSSKKAKEDIPMIIELYHIFIQVFAYGIKHFNYNIEYYDSFFDAQNRLVGLWLDMHSKHQKLPISFDKRI